MNPILIFRHIECEGPGYLANFLDSHKIPYQLVCLDKDDAVPSSIEDISALVFMGGSMSVNDTIPWIQDEIELIRRAQMAGLPVLGHCLGGQLIAKALGARVERNPVREIGWHDVFIMNNELRGKWFGDLSGSFRAFHWHGETFSLPQGATNMLSSSYCPHQGFVLGRTLALQCHIEMTAELVQKWLIQFAGQLNEVSLSVQSPGEIQLHLEEDIGRLNKIADIIYSRWLEGLITTL